MLTKSRSRRFGHLNDVFIAVLRDNIAPDCVFKTTEYARMNTVHAPLAPKPVGNYPHAKRVGNLLFLSGIGPRVAGSNAIPGNLYAPDGSLRSYDIAAQCRSVFANVKAVLLAAGADWLDLVDVTVYLTDMNADFATYNAIWAEYFHTDPPCRTTLGITALPTPIAIEMKCTAICRLPIVQ